MHPSSHTHALAQTHTYAVKVWKRLGVIAKQPKAPQGITNRPNPETTNTISRLQRKLAAVFVDLGGTAGHEQLISICVCVFIFA